MADEMKREEFFEYMEAFENRIKIQFEETRSLIRFSLEAVDALRETTERGFTEMRADHEEQTTLLKDAVTHVRARVERLERRRG